MILKATSTINFDKYSTAAVVQTLGFAFNLPTGGWSSDLAGLANNDHSR